MTQFFHMPETYGPNALSPRSGNQGSFTGAFFNALTQYAPKRQNALAGQAGDLGTPNNIGNRLMTDLMADFGMTRAEAAGIVGNLAHESGGFESLQEINPLVEGSRGGWGYAQWTGPRRRAFEDWTTERGLDPSGYDANYGYLKHELMNTPEGRVLSGIVGSGNADTTEEVATAFSNQFLRPGIPHMDSRLNYARRFAE